MTDMELLRLVAIGAIFGVIGQLIRILVGLKSLNEDAKELKLTTGELIVPVRLAYSILIGAVAGVLASLSLEKAQTFTTAIIMGLAAAGYAGTDFIEGVAKRFLPGQKAAVTPSIQSKIELNTFSQITSATKRLVFKGEGVESIVRRVLKDGNSSQEFDEGTTLESLGFDAVAKGLLAAALNREGIPVTRGAIIACDTVGDVIQACRDARA